MTAYAWDTRNRLASVTDYDNAGGPPTQVVDYIYATDDRWIGEDVDLDGDGQIDHQTRFVYDEGQIVLQFDHDGEGAVTADDLSHRYLWQPDVVDQLIADEQLLPISDQEAGGEQLLPSPTGRGAGGEGSIVTYDLTQPGDVVWALTDHLGTVRDLAANDEVTGVTTIANHRVFNSFGKLTPQTTAAIDCLFAYTGRTTDALTGLQDNWHRKYDASTTVWLSKDPITAHPTKAYLVSWIPRILRMRNSASLNS